MLYLIVVVVAWAFAMWVGMIAAVFLYPVALLGSTLTAIGLYLMQVRAVLMPDTWAGPSPVLRRTPARGATRPTATTWPRRCGRTGT